MGGKIGMPPGAGFTPAFDPGIGFQPDKGCIQLVKTKSAAGQEVGFFQRQITLPD